MEVAVRDLMKALDAFAPFGLAESWDRSGLQVGDPGAPVEAVLAALDPSPAAAAEARNRGVQLLVTHHPLFLDPLTQMDLSSVTGRLIADLVQGGIGLVSCHTNLDRAQGGVNDLLARRLGLDDVEPLLSGERQLKLSVTVPPGCEPAVRSALLDAGCSPFFLRGTGFFGKDAGRPEEMAQTRVEAAVPQSRSSSVRRAVAAVVPARDLALELCPLEGASREGALGRMGRLPEPVPLGEFAEEAVRRLKAPGLRYAGDPSRRIQRVAVIGGSGASLWREARQAGADALVTGDVKFHTAREAEQADFCLVDGGHASTEASAVEALAACLQGWASACGARLRVETYLESDPFHWVAR